MKKDTTQPNQTKATPPAQHALYHAILAEIEAHSKGSLHKINNPIVLSLAVWRQVEAYLKFAPSPDATKATAGDVAGLDLAWLVDGLNQMRSKCHQGTDWHRLLTDAIAQLKRMAGELEVERARGQFDFTRCETLKAKLAAADRELAAVKFTVVTTIGGTVEGHPTHEINYLQRLRELTAKEAALTEERAHADALAGALEQVARYPIASAYPDGPCVEKYDMADIKDALAAHAARRAPTTKGKL